MAGHGRQTGVEPAGNETRLLLAEDEQLHHPYVLLQDLLRNLMNSIHGRLCIRWQAVGEKNGHTGALTEECRGIWFHSRYNYICMVLIVSRYLAMQDTVLSN